MLVYYADKRVTHDQVVTLDSRYQYILERYGQGEPDLMERIEKGLFRAREVEELIFNHTPADRHPDQLARI
jgi:hypothetical protein